MRRGVWLVAWAAVLLAFSPVNASTPGAPGPETVSPRLRGRSLTEALQALEENIIIQKTYALNEAEAEA